MSKIAQIYTNRNRSLEILSILFNLFLIFLPYLIMLAVIMTSFHKTMDLQLRL